MSNRTHRVVVVTGASRGIGQAICEAFGRTGATVAGVARSDLIETAERVTTAGGVFIPVQADLSKGTAEEAGQIIENVLAATGRVDVLVNNAGIIRRAPAVSFAEADWNEVLRVNLSAPFFLCQAVGRWWLGGGREKVNADVSANHARRLKIINIASLLSYQGGITVPAYAASKHGIVGVTKALANEWAREGINVNAIAPGYIATDNTKALREDATRNQTILERIPEGRWGAAEDISGGCLFLASGEADYMNGSVLNIDGGWLGR